MITVAVVARQVPREVERKTIMPILAKPVSRWQFVFGKFLGAMACLRSALVVFWAASLLISALKGVPMTALAVLLSTLVSEAARTRHDEFKALLGARTPSGGPYGPCRLEFPLRCSPSRLDT